MKKKKLTYSNFYAYILLIAPALIIYLIFFLVPIGSSLIFSFTNFNGINLNLSFVGLKNYKILFSIDTAMKETFSNTLIFAILVCSLQNAIAIFLAWGITKIIVARDTIRTIIFIPSIISPIVVAYLWTFIYGNDGLVNQILLIFNQPDLTRAWLGDKNTALYAIIIAHIWRFIGQCSILYVSNMMTIPKSLYEAADMDGGGEFVKFFKITFPLIAPATTINVITSFIGSLRAADIIIAMTEGRPAHATETVGSYIIEMMSAGNYGYASAISVILMAMILILNVLLFKRLTNREISF